MCVHWFTWMTVGTVAVGAAADPIFWEGNNHYYELIENTGISWEDARVAAESRTWLGASGHLATITTTEENTFIFSSVIPNGCPPAGGNTWNTMLGAKQDPGASSPTADWAWVTGEPFACVSGVSCSRDDNLSAENHEEDYLEAYKRLTHCPPGSGGEGWNDLPNSGVMLWDAYVVEYEPSVPAVSSWGLALLGILILTAATLVLRPRRASMA